VLRAAGGAQLLRIHFSRFLDLQVCGLSTPDAGGLVRLESQTFDRFVVHILQLTRTGRLAIVRSRWAYTRSTGPEELC